MITTIMESISVSIDYLYFDITFIDTIITNRIVHVLVDNFDFTLSFQFIDIRAIIFFITANIKLSITMISSSRSIDHYFISY